MKLTIKENNEKIFKPFSLVIEFQSKEEVVALFHHLNISTAVVAENADDSYEFDYDMTDRICTEIWEKLNTKLEENEND